MRYPYEVALKVAEEIVGWLKPYCSKVTIAGSLRRKKPDVGDIEILCISENFDDKDFSECGVEFSNLLDREVQYHIELKKLDYRLNKKGNRTYGKQNKLLVHCASGIPVDIFSTTEENWWVALVVRTGPKESNIKISMAAKDRELKFNAYGSGFSTVYDSKIYCHSEKEVFEAVGLPYLPPEER